MVRTLRMVRRAGALGAVAAGLWLATAVPSAAAPVPAFEDVERQTREFIGYFDSIRLTAEQEGVKREALTALPAPCCSDNTAYTCCCPCNLSRTIWGLTAYLITEHDYSAADVRAKVQEWIAFVNPAGFSGDTCYTGGCGRPFKAGGCGGMDPNRLVF